jgi:hypothetical protein
LNKSLFLKFKQQSFNYFPVVPEPLVEAVVDPEVEPEVLFDFVVDPDVELVVDPEVLPDIESFLVLPVVPEVLPLVLPVPEVEVDPLSESLFLLQPVLTAVLDITAVMRNALNIFFIES